MDARGVTEAELVEGTQRSSLDEWTAWTVESDKVLIF
jgi:sulfur relay (sulfurtransferase) complex TusBCD TusD component (DsrE family)